MILGSRREHNSNNNIYQLEITEEEFYRVLDGKPLKHITGSSKGVGEWQVRFKKFSKAKAKRMGLGS